MPNAVRLRDLEVFYDAMQELAASDGAYHGYTYKLYVGIFPDRSQSYYGVIRRYLLAMGCVTQVQRGARHSESVWQLHARPTADMLAALDREAILTPSQEDMTT